MQTKRIAVLLTCFNRKQKTLDCLEALHHQQLPADVKLEVYLVDDGSTDGTSEAVKGIYPEVHIFAGNGSLYWGGGMRFAWEEALKDDADFYLWLNDDTILDPDAVKQLLTVSDDLKAKGEAPAIVAISTRDPQTGEWTYGGMAQDCWWHPLRFSPILPKDEPQRCDTMCGNCVLIPREVVQRVGILDSAFVHYAGDWDYGLRAKQKGCSIWILPGYAGTCSANPKPAPRSEAQLQQELKKVDTPKGLALEDVTLQPMSEWKVLTQRNCGLLWPFYWVLPYRRLLWISFIGKFKNG